MAESNYLKELTAAIKNLSGEVKGMRSDLGEVKQKVKVLETKEDPNSVPRKPGETRHFHFESHDGAKPPGSILVKEPIGGWDIEAALKKLKIQKEKPPPIYWCIHKNGVVIHGNTLPLKGKLKELGGSWNKTLKAWIFPQTKIEDLKKAGLLENSKALV